MAAAAASTGRVALFHLVGITPEAPTRETAFQGRVAARDRRRDDGRCCARARRRLTSADGEALDLVVLGSPHFSLAEFRALAPLVEGRRRHPSVRVLVTTSRIMRDLAERGRAARGRCARSASS